jgi:hypothetical protein
MMVPTVHLNGTSKEELMRQLRDAYRALVKAMDALAEACPNGRDYYPQGPGAHGAAMKEHSERFAKLSAIACELSESLRAIELGREKTGA